jgi:hypothetical protein
LSATSHTPADARHSVDDDMKLSVGQLLLDPLQTSGLSQSPAAGRHSAVLFTSVGHVVDVPLQNSATSQTPAEARHSCVDGCTWFVGQAAADPVQCSTMSQRPVAARHSTVEGE